jgi:hypothetical protein
MKPILTLALFVLLAPSFSHAHDRDTLIRGVNVSFSYLKTIFPPSWQEAPISAKADPIIAGEVSRSKFITAKALAKYPVEMLAANLHAVYWLKKMSFYDVGYGGTNSTDALYLTNNGTSLGYTDDYLEQTFHHEFSSILFRNYPSMFDTSAWKAANLNFDYNDPEDGVGAIRNNASSQDLDTILCKRGMLTQYAMSSLENDINTVAQNLFCPSPGFWKIVDQYPRVKKKVNLLIAFYRKISTTFDESYFRKMAEKQS